MKEHQIVCYCGNNKPYIECCYLTKQMNNGFQKHAKNKEASLRNKHFAARSNCFFPGCSHHAISSHTISRGAQLSLLSTRGKTKELRDGNVVFSPYHHSDRTISLTREAPLRTASTLSLFCPHENKLTGVQGCGHDAILFHDVDALGTENIDPRRHRVARYMSAYRAICALLRKKQMEISLLNDLEVFDIHLSNVDQSWSVMEAQRALQEAKRINDESKTLVGNQVNRLSAQKLHMEEYFFIINGSVHLSANHFIHVAIPVVGEPPFMVSSACGDNLKDEGSGYYCLHTLKENQEWLLIVTLFPETSCFGGSTLQKLKFFLERSYEGSYGAKLLMETIFERHENIFLNPRWVNEADKKALDISEIMLNRGREGIFSEDHSISFADVDYSSGWSLKKSVFYGDFFPAQSMKVGIETFPLR